MRARRILVLLSASAFAAGSLAPAHAAARVRLPGSVPGWTSSATVIGKAPGKKQVSFRVYLSWTNSVGAEAYARAVSTPGNRLYGKYLTPTEFRSRFAPSASEVAQVKHWLRSNGMAVTYTPENRHYVQVKGTVRQANAAFRTTLTTYSYQGKRMLAPRTEMSVPSALTSISGVIGLDDSALLAAPHRRTDAPPAPGFRNGTPTSAYWAARRLSADGYAPHGETLPTAVNYPYAVTGYTPQQLRSAYGLDGVDVDGTGVTVAIIDAFASPTIRADVNEYSSRHGLPALAAGQLREVVPPGIYRKPVNPVFDPQGWWGEETLDVEAVHAMAPGADIVYVGAPNNQRDLDAAMNHVVDRKLATIVSNSYGFPYEALPWGYIKSLNDTFIQAAAEGIGIYFSSGDDGDISQLTGGTPYPAWPATSPWVTAVGGTSLAVGSSGNRVFETGWQTGKATWTSGPTWSEPQYLYGSGGGTSYVFPQPDYQADVVPAAMASDFRDGSAHRNRAMRTIPDISVVGDPTTGFLVGQTQTFSDGVYYDESRTGGTSLSCPLLAGMMALAEQARGHAIGFANPALYDLYGSNAIRDVRSTSDELASAGLGAADSAAARVEFANYENAADGYLYSLRYLGWDAPLTIHTVTGYDTVTGMGSPVGWRLIAALRH